MSILVSKTYVIEHNLPTQQDKVIILSKTLLALFFFRQNKCIIYNYLDEKIDFEISLPLGTHTSEYIESEELILAVIPNKHTLVFISLQTHQVVKEISYNSTHNVIPRIMLLQGNSFALCYRKQTLPIEIYADFVLRKSVLSNNIIQKFSNTTFVSYSQTKSENLQFKLISIKEEQDYSLHYDMKNKMIMKIEEISQDDILVVYVHKSSTYFSKFSLKEDLQTIVYQMKNEIFLDIILYNKINDLCVCLLWETFDDILSESAHRIIMLERIKEGKSSKVVVTKFPMKMAAIGNSLMIGSHTRFISHKQPNSTNSQKQSMALEKNQGKSRVEIFMVPNLRNSIVHLLTQSGMVRDFTSCIVRKVLSLTDY